MTAYYNEIDPYAAQWLRNLIDGGHIAHGVVDERDIRDVRPADLAGYTQCHFFAGIGGWSLALRLSGWPDDRPVWTGSCPCQSFSVAGKQAGFSDERHLWPVWFDLIRERKPSVVFGEQVEGAVRHGWLDLVSADMEGEGYACGAAVLGAHSVGAPHIRQRLYWVADADDARPQGWEGMCERTNKQPAWARSVEGRLADADGGGSQARHDTSEAARHGYSAFADGGDCRPDPIDGFWRNADWLFCRDGKWRPVEPGIQCLAHGVSARVGRLRAYGNAIVPQVAAEFIRASL